MQKSPPASKTVIVTLNWNGLETTVRLLRSFREAGILYPFWVVDNGSTSDDTNAFLEANPLTTVIRLGENYGFAGGMNRAIRMAMDAGFDFVYEINNDCLVTNDFVFPCVEIAETMPRAMIIGSRYMSKDDNGNYTKWGFHSRPEENDNYINGFLPTDHVVGCGMLIRCAPLMKTGGFDERYFCYGEENDVCWRLNDLGFLIGMCWGSLILHDHKGSNIGANHAYYGSRNLFLEHRKHPKRRRAFYRLVPELIILAWRLMLEGQTTIASAYIQGIHHGVLRKYGRRTSCPSKPASIFLLMVQTMLMTPLYPLYWFWLVNGGAKTGGSWSGSKFLKRNITNQPIQTVENTK